MFKIDKAKLSNLEGNIQAIVVKPDQLKDREKDAPKKCESKTA